MNKALLKKLDIKESELLELLKNAYNKGESGEIQTTKDLVAYLAAQLTREKSTI
jgi:hypothetical protein